MAKATLNFDVAVIASNEAEIKGLKGTRKEIGDKVNSIKVESYSRIIAELAANGVALTKRGDKSGLPVNVAKQLRENLAESGVTPASVKRYVENTSALLRVKPDLLCEPSATRVEMNLQADGLTSEGKIHEAGHPKEEDHDLKALAQKISKLDADERVRLDEYVRAYDEAAEAEAQKVSEAADNAESINSTLEALDAA